jgi:hypothetical protein
MVAKGLMMRLSQDEYDDAVFATSEEPDDEPNDCQDEEEHGYCPSCSGSGEGALMTARRVGSAKAKAKGRCKWKN